MFLYVFSTSIRLSSFGEDEFIIGKGLLKDGLHGLFETCEVVEIDGASQELGISALQRLVL